jgi:glutamate dehydrogenase (NAD(P)+)
MGTDETCMAWLKDEMGRVVGIPRVLGGIPLDTIGATGFGLAACAEVAMQYRDQKLTGCRVAIQGFGAVGKHAARYLSERGARIVAVCDSGGGTAGPAGLPVNDLIAFKSTGRSVHDFPGGDPIGRDDIVGVDCDVWIPAARPDVLRGDNIGRLKAETVIQGANIPATADAERWMFEHEVLSVPDFVANAGGVICAAVEYRGGSQAQAFEAIGERIRENTRLVIEEAQKSGRSLREAAEALAVQRVREAESYRRP